MSVLARLGPASRCWKPDSHARLTEYDFIVGVQPDAPRPTGDCNRPAATHDLGAVFAAVIVQSELTGERLVGDMRMAPRNGLVDVASSFAEHDVIGSNEAVAAGPGPRGPPPPHSRRRPSI